VWERRDAEIIKEGEERESSRMRITQAYISKVRDGLMQLA
jgi:hypothetical protein